MLRSAVLIFWMILIPVYGPFSWAEEKATHAPAPKSALQGYPVVLGDQVLFYVRGEVKGYSPEERAKAVSERIQKMADDPGIPIQVVTTSNVSEPMTLVSAGDKLLLLVFDEDALGEGRTREQLAKDYAEKLRTALEKYREDRSRKNILYGALYTFLMTVAFIVALVLLKKLKQRIDQRIMSRVSVRGQGIRIKSFEIIRPERVSALLLEAVRVVRFFLTLFLLYIYLHLGLSFFPWTRPFAGRVLEFILVPLTAVEKSVVEHIPNLVFIVIIVLIARYVLKLLKFFFQAVEKGNITFSGFYPEWSKPTYKIISYLVIAFFVVVAYPYIPGSDSQAFKGISIFVGVLFSLGSQSAVSNMIAGFALTYRRAFKVGDRVKIADFTGVVVETRVQVTTLRTIKNEDIVVPNSLIMGSHVINYSTEARQKGLILHTTVTIGYDAPWRRVHELLTQAAGRTEGILGEPRPFVLQTALNDFYVSYELNAYTDKPQEMDHTYSLLHQNIQDAFNEGGVEIMSPHYTQLRDGNKVTIPETYLPKDYVPGGLRVVQAGKTAESGERKGIGSSK